VSIESTVVDRRSVLKARHRRAILDAAKDLLVEHGGPGFSVEELAARADVSRRTVFNYFTSLTDVVLSAATETLEDSINDVHAATAATSGGAATRAEVFDAIAEILRGAALPAVVRALYRALGAEHEAGRMRAKQLEAEAFSRVADHLSAEFARRNPAVDQLDLDLLVVSLVHGVGVIAHHWVVSTDMTGPDAHAVWDRLFDRLLATVRAGYAPGH